MSFRLSRREFIAGLGMTAAATTISSMNAFASPGPLRSQFKIGVINDEIGQDFAHVCEVAAKEFYNSLEAPALNKYPLLALFQEFLKANGAVAVLMSGSGSTTFSLVKSRHAAEQLLENFKAARPVQRRFHLRAAG